MKGGGRENAERALFMYVDKIKAFFKNKNKDNKTHIIYGCKAWATTMNENGMRCPIIGGRKEIRGRVFNRE